jgi:hypothetical protein
VADGEEVKPPPGCRAACKRRPSVTPALDGGREFSVAASASD